MDKRIFESEYLYVILSPRHSDYVFCTGRPLVAENKMGRSIAVFTDERSARTYVEENHLDIIDSIYPIGKISVNDDANGLRALLMWAYASDISILDLDNGNVTDIYSLIENSEVASAHVYYSDEEIQEVPFPIIPMTDADDKYIMTEERHMLLINRVLTGSVDDILSELSKESLFELCHTFEYASSDILTTAVLNGDNEMIQKIGTILMSMQQIILTKLNSLPELYTIVSAENGQPYTYNDKAYVIYTDRFRFTDSRYVYRRLPKSDPLQWLERNTGASKFSVVEGPLGISLPEK